MKPHHCSKEWQRIDITNPQRLHEQSLYLGKPPNEVAFAVSQVGPSMDAVAAFLGV